MANYQSTFTGAQIDDGVTKARAHETSKANIDGLYEDLTSGNALQVVATVGEEDKAPYNKRTSGGSANIGTREKKSKIVGGTLAFNQLASLTASDWTLRRASLTASGHKLTITPTNSTNSLKRANIPIKAGHKYLISGKYLASESDVSLTIGLYSDIDANNYSIRQIYNYNDGDQNIAVIMTAQNTDLYFSLVLSSSTTPENNAVVENLQVVDLTLMFGATIANYINTLETANAGAGVAWLKKFFPKDYYAYNAGELMSVKTSAHKTVGFNAYNNTAGTAKLLGGNEYQITGTYTAISYTDINGNAETITPDEDGKFTPTNDGTMTVTGGNATDTCVHLVWSGYRNDDYEEYNEHVYSLDSDLELRGIPKLDENDNLYYNGDEYESDGTVTRKYGIVDMGILSYAHSSQYRTGLFRTTKTGILTNAKILCAIYPTGQSSNSSSHFNLWENKTIHKWTGSGDPTAIYIVDESYSDAATFKTAMSGVYLVYELATPTTESADPYQETQIVDDFGTEEFVDSRDVPIPVGHETLYGMNIRDKVQNAPESPSSDGDYKMRRSNGKNTYVQITETEELPTAPTTDGTYLLKITVADGEAALSWEAES